jgi:hypothetical protein
MLFLGIAREDTEIVEAIVISQFPQVDDPIPEPTSHPAWSAILNLERASQLMMSELQFNPVQPLSDLIQRDSLPRPIYEDDWLEFPFPSVVLPINHLSIGDIVLVALSFAGDVSLQAQIKGCPGSVFGHGPYRTTILPSEVELEIIWINREHRSIRLPDQCTRSDVEFVADLNKHSSWLFPWTCISHV